MNDHSSLAGTPPFLKWAGGKRWFSEKYRHLLPTNYGRYFEPFLGSAAVFFGTRPAHSTLSDLNSDLIHTFQIVKDHPNKLSEALASHHASHSQEYYYAIRDQKPEGGVELAAWFIYLNRTCWNGLYRVNKHNVFNVPIGTKSAVLMDTDNFEDLSVALSNSHIVCQDFELTIDSAADGDFLFIDPPYTVKHNLNGFVKYNDKIFSWRDQVRLRDCVVRAVSRGAMAMITNANHASIRELYSEVGTTVVLGRSSVLAASAQYRTRVEELAIRTWS